MTLLTDTGNYHIISEMENIEKERDRLNSIPMIELRGYKYIDVLFRLKELHDRYQELLEQWDDPKNPYNQKFT